MSDKQTYWATTMPIDYRIPTYDTREKAETQHTGALYEVTVTRHEPQAHVGGYFSDFAEDQGMADVYDAAQDERVGCPWRE